jgi:hypothetical protein
VSIGGLAPLAWAAVAVACLTPQLAAAQGAAPASLPADPLRSSRMWIVIGAAATSVLGDCTDCEADNYLHSGSVMGKGGVAINQRIDVGGELVWVPVESEAGQHLRVTFLMASVQFRPWTTRGFFLNAATGMAFIGNWLVTIPVDAPPQRSKAFGLEVGAGWEWRTRGPVGVQVFGGQYVAALGDLETDAGTAQNVVGNFWSIGTAIVIR